MLAGPGATVMVSTSKLRFALPLASDLRLGMSPAWRSALPGLPCGLPKGLKCPLALMPSPELQSPASWMWKPASLFGLRPAPVPCTRALLPLCVKWTVPRTLLPLVGWRLAIAFSLPPDHQFWIVSHPASSATAANTVAGCRRSGFIRWRSGGAPLYSFLGRLGRRHRSAALGLLVVSDYAVLRLGEVVGVLRLGGGRLVGLRLLLGVALRRGCGQLGMRRGNRPGKQPCDQHQKDALHDFSFMWGAPAGTAPDAAAPRPDFMSLYQYSWCSLAQTSST